MVVGGDNGHYALYQYDITFTSVLARRLAEKMITIALAFVKHTNMFC